MYDTYILNDKQSGSKYFKKISSDFFFKIIKYDLNASISDIWIVNLIENTIFFVAKVGSMKLVSVLCEKDAWNYVLD